MSKRKTRGEKIWFIRWSKSEQCWYVQYDGFHPYHYNDKYLAEKKRDELNALGD